MTHIGNVTAFPTFRSYFPKFPWQLLYLCRPAGFTCLMPPARCTPHTIHVPTSPVAIEVPDISVPDFLLSKVDAFGDAVAMVDGPTGRELTYSAMKAQIRAVAAGLTSRGFKKGDVMAIISPVC